MKKVIIAVVILAILAGGGFGGWKWYQAKRDPMNQPPVFAEAPVIMGDLEVVVEGWGPLLPVEDREVSSAATGSVKKVLVKSGDRVSQGQELVVLENATLAMEIQQKQLELDQKKLQLARRLNPTPDKIDQVGAEQALRIVAPASGRLTDFTYKVREEISAGALIGKVVDDSGLVVEVLAASQIYNNVKKGDKVKVYFSEFTGEMQASIHEIESNPIPGDQGFFYRISILLNNPGLLKVGMKPQVIFSLPGIEVQQQGEIVRYKAEENIVPNISGAITNIYAKNGDWVNKGQLIATVEEGNAMSHVISDRLQINSLQLDIENKINQMQNMVVRAPIDGIVMEVLVKETDQVSVGTKIAKIANYDMMRVDIMIDEYDIAKVRKGQEAVVTVDGMPGVEFAGLVYEVALMGETREGLAGFPVKIDIPAPEGLRGGMNANVSIFIDSKSNVVLVPIEAVYEEGDLSFVQVLEEGMPVAKEVTIGLTSDRFAEVISGLEPGTMVVVGSSMDMMDHGFGPGGPNDKPVQY